MLRIKKIFKFMVALEEKLINKAVGMGHGNPSDSHRDSLRCTTNIKLLAMLDGFTEVSRVHPLWTINIIVIVMHQIVVDIIQTVPDWKTDIAKVDRKPLTVKTKFSVLLN